MVEGGGGGEREVKEVVEIIVVVFTGFQKFGARGIGFCDLGAIG